jgi:hypothetical protein
MDSELHLEYMEAQKNSNDLFENNDCAVMAVSLATSTPYPKVHSMFQAAGRKNRGCSNDVITEWVVRQLGFSFYRIEKDKWAHIGKTVRTFERNIKQQSHPFMIWVRGHVLCMKQKTVLDWSQGRCNRIGRITAIKKDGKRKTLFDHSNPVFRANVANRGLSHLIDKVK